MRVLLDATGLGSGAGGDETMLTGVLEGLALVAGDDDRFDVVAADDATLPASVLHHRGFTVTRLPRRSGALHFTTVMPRVVRRARPRPDLVFSPTHGPVVSGVPVALMVQDLSFEHRPDDYPPATRVRLQQVVRRQVRSARVVLTVSEDARVDLVRTYGLDPARVFHVPNATLPPPPLDHDAAQGVRRWLAEEGVGGHFLLYLGNLHPRKNVVRAIEAFGLARRQHPELADLQLVVAGGRWWGSGEQDAAAACAPEGSVVFLGRVDEVQREVLLRDARALVYLSLFEGFGLPPLEAMARGTPVVASERTSIPEVVGDGGLLVDPLDVGAAADAMVRLATDDALRSQLRDAGLRRAAHYDVRSTGLAMHAALTTALDLSGTMATSAPAAPATPVRPAAQVGCLVGELDARGALPAARSAAVVVADGGDGWAVALGDRFGDVRVLEGPDPVRALGGLADASVDLVVADGPLDRLGAGAQRDAVVEVCRVLAPGGIAVVRLAAPPSGVADVVAGAVPRPLSGAVAGVLHRVDPPTAPPGRVHGGLPARDVWDAVERHGCVVADTVYVESTTQPGRLVVCDPARARQQVGAGVVTPAYLIRRTVT